SETGKRLFHISDVNRRAQRDTHAPCLIKKKPRVRFEDVSGFSSVTGTSADNSDCAGQRCLRLSVLVSLHVDLAQCVESPNQNVVKTGAAALCNGEAFPKLSFRLLVPSGIQIKVSKVVQGVYKLRVSAPELLFGNAQRACVCVFCLAVMPFGLICTCE